MHGIAGIVASLYTGILLFRITPDGVLCVLSPRASRFAILHFILET